MVDAILSKYNEIRYRGVYNKPMALSIRGTSLHHVPGSTRLVVIFPRWHGGPSFYASYRQSLHKHGISTLYFDLEPGMLHANVMQVTHNFATAASMAYDEISSIMEEYGFVRLELQSFSLGNAVTGMLVERFGYVDTVRLIVPGDSLAGSFWHSSATKNVRLSLEAQGVTEEELLEAWKPMSLIDFAPLLAKNVDHIYITLAKADRFIAYERGKRLVNALRKQGANLHVEEMHMGHGATMLRYVSRGIKLDKSKTRKLH